MFTLKNRWIYISLLALYSFFNIRFTGGDHLVNAALPDWFLGTVILLMVVSLWEGNRLIQKFLRISIPRIHPLITNFFLSILLVLIIAFLPLVVIPDLDNGFSQDFKLSVAFAFRVNLFLHIVNAIIFYFNELKDAQVETQMLKRQTVEAQFEALRNQINPHFLFNSFNVLSNLVYKDADQSAKFIQQLSKVYRYLINHQEKKLVPLQEELEFIASYLYLLKIRFSDNLEVQMTIPQNLNSWQIAPASLQMLIENAIKHNILSQNKPLRVVIEMDDTYISVSNNIQLKKNKENSTGIGLKNIIKRYEFLCENPVQVENNQRQFSVRIPLIELPPYESVNRRG